MAFNGSGHIGVAVRFAESDEKDALEVVCLAYLPVSISDVLQQLSSAVKILAFTGGCHLPFWL